MKQGPGGQTQPIVILGNVEGHASGIFDNRGTQGVSHQVSTESVEELQATSKCFAGRSVVLDKLKRVACDPVKFSIGWPAMQGCRPGIS
jgi:hypothetical protein